MPQEEERCDWLLKINVNFTGTICDCLLLFFVGWHWHNQDSVSKEETRGQKKEAWEEKCQESCQEEQSGHGEDYQWHDIYCKLYKLPYFFPLFSDLVNTCWAWLKSWHIPSATIFLYKCFFCQFNKNISKEVIYLKHKILIWLTSGVSLYCVMTPVQEGEPERVEKKDIAIIEMDAEHNPSLPRAIVLDLSPVNFLDTVGVKTLRSVWFKNSTSCICAFVYSIIS